MDLSTKPDAFPAPSRQTAGGISSIPTNITRLDFSDKILLTISQAGRLSQWIQVPLLSTTSSAVEMTLPSQNPSLLPSTHLTPVTLLGGGGDERETLGQLYARQIAGQMSLRNPEDRRTLVLGLGLEKAKGDGLDREGFYDMLELVGKVM